MTDVVGFIGAGQLGEPMVARLLDAGREVLVYARRDDVRGRVKNLGAELVDSVSAVAAGSDVLISCLFSDGQLRELGAGAGGFIANAKPDAVFVSHTTGSLATLTALADESDSAPVILDAPVSGTAEHIASGSLTVLIGGPAAEVERVTPVLSAYANPIVPTGALGTALDIKLINNLLFAANAQLVAAAAQLGERLGVEEEKLLAALAVCSGGSNSASYARKVGGIAQFATMAAPFLRKDIAACLAAAEAVNADLGLLGEVARAGSLDLTTGKA